MIVHDPFAVPLGDALERRHQLAGSRRRTEIELHDAPLLRQLDFLDLVERLDAALDLRGLGGVRREPFDEPLLLGEHRLLARIGGLAVRFANRALPFVEIVVARIGGDLAAVDLGDLASRCGS